MIRNQYRCRDMRFTRIGDDQASRALISWLSEIGGGIGEPRIARAEDAAREILSLCESAAALPPFIAVLFLHIGLARIADACEFSPGSPPDFLRGAGE